MFNRQVPGVPRSADNVHLRFNYLYIIFTDKTFTADINQNVTLSWTTSLTELFNVHPPFNSTIIYNVHIGGTIILNSNGGKYIFEDNPKDVKAINITVIHVNKIDAGLYSAKDDSTGNVNGCCLLIVASKILTLSYSLYDKFRS